MPAPSSPAPRWTRLTPEQVTEPNARLATPLSARTGFARWQRFLGFALSFGAIVGAVAAPAATLVAAIVVLSTLVAGITLLRLAVLIAARPWAPPAPPPPLADPGPDAPSVAVIAALHREGPTLPVLLAALTRLRYPRERLRVLLAVEGDDVETLAALADLAPDAPPWLEVVELPANTLRTKPRALNAAWAYLEREGPTPEILLILDAEDQPAPDLVARAAEALRAAPPAIAAVQARLAYYNARENWLSRCFAIEYATWFDVTLTGLVALGAPIPLGGSSVAIRVEALTTLGGWDAHNVTEDADLGVRLARFGYGVALIDSTTEEEAVCRPGAWVRQRSRWLKGYAQTWATLSRRPGVALAELGAWRLLLAQLLLIGGPISALAQPLLLGAFAAALLGVGPDWASGLGLFGAALLALLAIGQLVLLASALAGVRRRDAMWLAPWCLTLPLYWPLSALAAYKALFELIAAPFYWDKTRHGVGRMAAAMRAEALGALKEKPPR